MASNTVSQGVKVGILTLLFLGGGYAVWKGLSSTPSGEDGYELTAKFKDAKGLKLDSAVEVAGVPVGEITEIGIEGRYARVKFRVRKEIKVYEDAIVHKRAQSLLGGFYLELEPGNPQSRGVGEQGTIKNNQLLGVDDIRPEFKGSREIKREIINVTEATTPEQLMRRVEETLPVIDDTLRSITGLSEDIRQLVNVPIRNMADRLNSLVQEGAPTVTSILNNVDRSVEKIERISQQLDKATNRGQIEQIITNINEASAEAKTLLTSARNEVEVTGKALRTKMDKLDRILDSSGSIAEKINDDEGTLGRLVNDGTIADNIEGITEDAGQFINTLTGMKSYVGLRTEYSTLTNLARFYVSVELMTRPDKGYYIEGSIGPRGGQPSVELRYDAANGGNAYNRVVTIEDKPKFTFMLMKRWNWATFRYGIKDSSGGVGLDLTGKLFNNPLKLEFDVFDPSFDVLPRLKITGKVRILKNLYLMAGVDDLLNERDSLPVNAGNVDNPRNFETFPIGRDVFVGAYLSFDDRDLTSLLTVAGGAIGGLAQ